MLACKHRLDENGVMKIKEGGKEHQIENPVCNACKQDIPNGYPGSTQFPFRHACGGFMHSEAFGTLNTGLEIVYKCDLCGEGI